MAEYSCEVIKNAAYRFVLKKDHFYHIDEQHFAGIETNHFQRNFVPYSGLSGLCVQESGYVPAVSVWSGELPDGEVIDDKKFCFAPEGHWYWSVGKVKNYFLQNQDCLISADGMASGFSPSNKIYYNRKMSGYSSYKFIFKVKPDNLGDHNVVISSAAAERYAGIRATNSCYCCYAGSWINGSTPLTAGNTYWFGGYWDGSKLYGYMLADNGSYTLDTLPDFSSWSKEWETSSDIFNNVFLYFGVNIYTGSEYLRGTIDLSQSAIWVDNDEFFKWNLMTPVPFKGQGILADGLADDGLEKSYNLFYDGHYVLDVAQHKSGMEWVGSLVVPAHTVYDAVELSDSWEAVGWPTIDNYGVSGCDANAYIRSTYVFNYLDITKEFNIQIKIHTPSNFSNNREDLLYCGTTSQQGPCIGINANTHTVFAYLSSGGTTYSYVSSSATILQADTDYWIRIYKPDTTFFASAPSLQISTDGETWSYESGMVALENTLTANSVMCLGVNPSSTEYAFGGKIYFEDTFVEIDGQCVWKFLE